jgi:hypothetical protein
MERRNENMTVDYKNLTAVMLTQIWPRFVELTEVHRKDNNITNETNEVDWEAITKPGLFTIGLFFVTAIFRKEQDQEFVIFYISIAAQNIELRLQFDTSVQTLNDAIAFTPTLTDSHGFRGVSLEALENVGNDWNKWLTWAKEDSMIAKST